MDADIQGGPALITGLLNEGLGTTLGYIALGGVVLGVVWIISKFTK